MTTLTQESLNELLATIDPEKVELVYVGKKGCACGCKGTYTEGVPAAKRTLNRLKKQAQWFHAEHWILSKAFKGETILSFEPDYNKRATRLYVKA